MALEGGAQSVLSIPGAEDGGRAELAARLAAAAADLDGWVQQRQPLLLLLRLLAQDATTAPEVSAVGHQAHALVEQAQAMVQQIRALHEQLASLPQQELSQGRAG